MKTEIARVQEQLDEAVSILNLNLQNLLSREYSKIPTELRAISVADLSRLARFIRDKCEEYGWVDSYAKKIVSNAEDVNLYHLVHNFVGPVTAPAGYEEVEESLQLGPEGEAPDGVAYEKEHNGKRRLRYVRGFPRAPAKGEQDKFVRTFCGSFAELLCNEEQEADFFCSHWWGMPILDFVACIVGHDEAYLGRRRSLYWVCAYANCQARIADELGSEGPLKSPFYKALTAAKGGAVLLIDANSTVVTRMWCGFENVAIASEEKTLAMATCVEGTGHILTNVPAPCDFGASDPPLSVQYDRQTKFPAERVAAAVGTDLERAEASNEEDKTMIIKCVKEDFGGFDVANSKLRVMAAAGAIALRLVDEKIVKALNDAVEPYDLAAGQYALHQALDLGLGFQQCAEINAATHAGFTDSQMTALGQGLGAAKGLSKVDLQFYTNRECGDAGVTGLTQGLGAAKSMTDLSLWFSWSNFGDAGMTAVGQMLESAMSIRVLGLHFCWCDQIGDAGVAAVAQKLGDAKSLVDVSLRLRSCDKVGDAGVMAMVEGLGGLEALSSVGLYFETSDTITDTGMIAVGQWIGEATNLTNVTLYIAGCCNLTDAGATALGLGLAAAQGLCDASVQFHDCGVGDAGVTAVGQGIGALKSLTKVWLRVKACDSVGDAGVTGLGQGLGAATSLIDVSLYLQASDKFSDVGVTAVAQGLGALQSLKILYLYIHACDKVSDVGMTAVGQGLGAAKSLSDVTVYIESCDNVGDAGATAVGQELGALKNLTNVALTFWRCCKVGDAAATAVGQGLGVSESLTSVYVYFDFDGGDGGMTGLGQGLQAAKNLTKVDLNFGGANYSGEGRDEVVQALADVTA